MMARRTMSEAEKRVRVLLTDFAVLGQRLSEEACPLCESRTLSAEIISHSAVRFCCSGLSLDGEGCDYAAIVSVPRASERPRLVSVQIDAPALPSAGE